MINIFYKSMSTQDHIATYYHHMENQNVEQVKPITNSNQMSWTHKQQTFQMGSANIRLYI